MLTPPRATVALQWLCRPSSCSSVCTLGFSRPHHPYSMLGAASLTLLSSGPAALSNCVPLWTCPALSR